jgi:hypothetical protein
MVQLIAIIEISIAAELAALLRAMLDKAFQGEL